MVLRWPLATGTVYAKAPAKRRTVPSSLTVARTHRKECDFVIDVQAGPEIGVAATKSFSATGGASQVDSVDGAGLQTASPIVKLAFARGGGGEFRQARRSGPNHGMHLSALQSWLHIIEHWR